MAHSTTINIRRDDPAWADQLEQLLERLTRDFNSFTLYRDGERIIIFSEHRSPHE